MKQNSIKMTSVGTDPRILRQHYAETRYFLLGKQKEYQAKKSNNHSAALFKKSASSAFSLLMNLVLAVALLAGIIWWAPKLYYSFFSTETSPVSAQVVADEKIGQFEQQGGGQDSGQKTDPVVSETADYMPPIDASLPEGDWIVIPKIGVNSQLQSTVDSNEALEKGIWMAPDYGKPGDRQLPMIVAGHRFGWDWWWKTDYGKKNSFNMLPSLEVGDKIEIISGQRKWIYEIYAGEEGQEITDYSADAIFYTCKYLNSPVRYFRYAKIIDPSKSTQQTSVESDKEAGESGLMSGLVSN